MKKIAIAIALAALAFSTAACTDPKQATLRALEGQGYSNIRVEGYEFINFGCGENDGWARDFTAVGPTGHYVSGTACGGFIGKGTTLRFD